MRAKLDMRILQRLALKSASFCFGLYLSKSAIWPFVYGYWYSEFPVASFSYFGRICLTSYGQLFCRSCWDGNSRGEFGMGGFDKIVISSLWYENNRQAVILVCLDTIVMQMRFVTIQTLLNFGMMKVNSGHRSGHPNRNIRHYESEGNDDDIGEGGEPILPNCLTLISRVQCLGLNQTSAVLRAKSVECSA